MINKILFIINPTSRAINKTDTESYISRLSGEYKCKCEIYYTEKSEPKTRIREKILEYQPDIAVAAGGDGTVNQVAAALIGSKTELGIIPAGSANGLAYNLGIPSDFDEAMHIILHENAKPLDAIGFNNSHYCFHLGDVGINARIVKRFEKEGSQGLLGYGKHLVKELFSKRRVFSVKIAVPGMNKKFRAELLVIANARSFGTGAVINPAGEPDDGEFEIIIIKPYHAGHFLQLVRMLVFGKIDNLQYIKVIKTKKAEITFNNPQDMQLDGEIVKGVALLKVKIIPAAVRVRYKSKPRYGLR